MNEQILLRLGRIFDDAIRPLRISFLYNNNEYAPYSCLYSNAINYITGNQYELYQINPLLRTLAKKSDILTPELYKELFANDINDHLCFILKWDDFDRKILIFDLGSADTFNNTNFIEAIGENFDTIIEIFNDQIKTMNKDEN